MNAKRSRPYGYTPHDVADAYRRKGWGSAGNREAWYGKLRYSGKFSLPTAEESAIVQGQQKTPHKQ